MGKKRRRMNYPKKFGRKFPPKPAVSPDVIVEVLKKETKSKLEKQKVDEMSNKRKILKEKQALEAEAKKEVAVK